MNPLTLLTISFMSTTLMIVPLLYTQRHKNKPTISHYATKSPMTHGFYLVWNIIATTSFYIFALSFFKVTLYSGLLIATSSVGYICGIVQAVIPARGKIEKYHGIFSYATAFFMIITGLLAVFLIPQTLIVGIVTKTIAVCFILVLPLSFIVKTKHYYRIQIAGLLIFYIELFLVVVGISV